MVSNSASVLPGFSRFNFARAKNLLTLRPSIMNRIIQPRALGQFTRRMKRFLHESAILSSAPAEILLQLKSHRNFPSIIPLILPCVAYASLRCAGARPKRPTTQPGSLRASEAVTQAAFHHHQIRPTLRWLGPRGDKSGPSTSLRVFDAHCRGASLTYSRAKADHMAAETIEGAELALTIGPTLDAMMMIGALPGERLPLTRAIVGAICRDQAFDFAMAKS
jgi:hypothetical protein